MNGIIVIDKPQDMTSHDVVSFLRRKTGEKRIGHSGTLDPMATGVLPVFIGKATRVIEYASLPGDQEAKLYRCTMKLGLETDTQDIWGRVLKTSAALPDISEIERVLRSFEGPGAQLPPMYSAVKIGGRKLYEYARKGVVLDESLVNAREIYIKHIEVKEIDLAAGTALFDILCSKGVYIRTLCADAGRMFGCGAVMSGLKRLKSDGFTIESSISIAELKDGSMPSLLPLDAPIEWMPRIDLDGAAAQFFTQGRIVELEDCGTREEVVRVYSNAGFIGIGRKIINNELKPEKVLI